LAGPVVPLGALGATSDQLAGGAGGRGQVENAEAVRVLVRGEAAGGATGRADDFAWPRQASVSPNDILPAPDTSQPPRAVRPVAATPATPARTGAPAAAPAAQSGQKTPADAERRAKPRPRPQQAQAPQQQQQQPGGFRLFTPGGDPRSAPRPPQPIGPSAQRPSWNPFGGGF
jgi:hypothetical protein